MTKVLVVGSGAMGSGIVQACAQSGYEVTVTDVDEGMLRKAMENIEWSLGKLEEKQSLREPKDQVLARIKTASSLDPGRGARFVIEAIYEDKSAKQKVLKELESICSPDTILATNTSSIPITDIAAGIGSPERVIGIHFFNPVHRMNLVEVVKGLCTSEETVSSAMEFARTLGKEPVLVNSDIAGFIVNRINGMAFLEALKLLEQGTASVEDIDKAMRLGLGHPMGPFELMDMVGLDVVLHAREGIYNETRSPEHYPPTILRRMVAAGHLGRKTKKGFYDYSETEGGKRE
ncbi:MAG: 3-hydroxyacyl-CoA dehydrogenase family protein [Dehalococcoidia bacterium]